MSSTPTPAEIQYYKAHANDNRQPKMIAMAVCGLIIAYCAVMLRIVARARSATNIGADDGLIVAALLPLTGYAVCSFLAVHFGEGKHIIFVTDLRGFIEEYVAAITSYSTCVILTKSSILCFYNRIFPSKWLHVTSWIITAVVIAYNISLVLVTALECIPLSALWTGKPATCFRTLPPFTVLAVVNVITDVLILALPIKFVIKLHMRAMRKVQVCGIFLLGGVVCVFGIVRCVFIATAAPSDTSYTAVYSGIWSNAEIAVGVVAACLPTLGILFSSTKAVSLRDNSALRLLSNTWSRLTGFAAGSNEKVSGDVSLRQWPRERRYHHGLGVSNEGMPGEYVGVRSFVKLGDVDLEQNLPEREAGPGAVSVKQELSQWSTKVRPELEFGLVGLLV